MIARRMTWSSADPSGIKGSVVALPVLSKCHLDSWQHRGHDRLQVKSLVRYKNTATGVLCIYGCINVCVAGEKIEK